MPEPVDQTIVLPGNIKVPLPPWAKTLIGAIAVVVIGFGSYRYFYPVEPELISVKQANDRLKLEVSEYNQHIAESPIATLEAPEKIRVAAFEDGCVIITTRNGRRASTRLLLDPDRAESKQTSASSFGVAVLYAAEQAKPAPKCLNPHPGKFTWVYGEKAKGERCWIPVIRTFADSCSHTQLYNSCSASWASNPDGTPQITWTRCVH